MEMDIKFSLMGVFMRGSGKIIYNMVKAGSSMEMVGFMMEIGKKARLMEKEAIYMLMVHNTKDNGKMTFNTGSEKKYGLMVDHMKGSIGRERSMEKVHLNGKMDPCTLEISPKI